MLTGSKRGAAEERPFWVGAAWFKAKADPTKIIFMYLSLSIKNFSSPLINLILKYFASEEQILRYTIELEEFERVPPKEKFLRDLLEQEKRQGVGKYGYDFIQQLALGLPSESSFTADFTDPNDRQVIIRGVKSIQQEITKEGWLVDFQAYMQAIKYIQDIFRYEINNVFNYGFSKTTIHYNSARFEEMAIFAGKTEDVSAFRNFFSDNESKDLGREEIRKLVAETYEEFLKSSPLGKFVEQIKQPGSLVDDESLLAANRALYEHSEDDFIKANLCNIPTSNKFELLVKLLPQKDYDSFVNKFLQRIAFIQMHEEGIHTFPLNTPLKFSQDLINKFHLFILEFRRILYGDPSLVRRGDQRRCEEFSQHLKDLMLVELGLYQIKQSDDSKEFSPLSAGTPGLSGVNGISPTGSTVRVHRSLTPDLLLSPVGTNNVVLDLKDSNASSTLQSPNSKSRNTTNAGFTLSRSPVQQKPKNQLSLEDQAGLARLLSMIDSKSDQQFRLSVSSQTSQNGSRNSVSVNSQSSRVESPMLKKGTRSGN